MVPKDPGSIPGTSTCQTWVITPCATEWTRYPTGPRPFGFWARQRSASRGRTVAVWTAAGGVVRASVGLATVCDQVDGSPDNLLVPGGAWPEAGELRFGLSQLGRQLLLLDH